MTNPEYKAMVELHNKYSARGFGAYSARGFGAFCCAPVLAPRAEPPAVPEVLHGCIAFSAARVSGWDNFQGPSITTRSDVELRTTLATGRDRARRTLFPL